MSVTSSSVNKVEIVLTPCSTGFKLGPFFDIKQFQFLSFALLSAPASSLVFEHSSSRVCEKMKHNETLMISLEEIDWNYLIETVNEPPKNLKSDVYIVRARDKRRLQNDVLRKRLSEQNGINILIIFPFDGEQSGSSL